MFQQLKQELEELPALSPADLNMSNLIQFPQTIYKLLVWMVRQREFEVETVAAYLGQDEASTMDFLDLLVSKGLVEAREIDSGMQYKVRVRSSRNYRVPGQIWKVLDE